jgi:hypothetical protein
MTLLNICVFYVDDVQERMAQNLSTDPAATRASHKTRCVGHRTTRTNRRLGGLSTWGRFDRLGRTLLLFVGRISRTGLVHRGLHQMARPRLWLSMPGRWRICGRSYVPSESETTSWSSVCEGSRHSWPRMAQEVLNRVHLQT